MSTNGEPDWSRVENWPHEAYATLLRAINRAEATALRSASNELAENSSLVDRLRREDPYLDARDDERTSTVLWLRERADERDQ